MGNIAPPHWVVTHGKHLLVPRPRYKTTVTRKGSIQLVTTLCILKQGSVTLVTKKMSVTHVILESGLGREVTMTTPTPVGMKQLIVQIMEKSTSKPWDIS